jgi:hypothetical protein
MNDRLRVHYHVDLGGRERKQVVRLDDFETLVH